RHARHFRRGRGRLALDALVTFGRGLRVAAHAAELDAGRLDHLADVDRLADQGPHEPEQGAAESKAEQECKGYSQDAHVVSPPAALSRNRGRLQWRPR